MPSSEIPAETLLAAFSTEGHKAIDWIVEYINRPNDNAVLPDVKPGEVRAALPAGAPIEPEALDAIVADFHQLIVPATTHWNHPGFMAYFATTGTPPGILAELFCAALNVNAMVWRTGPAATELEEVTLGWLRSLIGLPASFDGTINDTASTSTFYALAAARESLTDLRLRQEGMTGRTLPRVRVYCSEDTHSSIDKAVLALGLGLSGLRKIPTLRDYSMDADALAAALAEDLAAGVRPMAVVANVGTTSTTAVDPVPRIAELCRRHGIWLHVDAAYGGSAAILPEMRWILAGCDAADSFVINPHKWLGVPVDCSVLYTRHPDLLKAAFSLTPEYLVTPEGAHARNLMDYGIALGRRFRALKLWFVLRAYGVTGIQAQLRNHIQLARELADRIDAQPHFQRLAPVRFSTVIFRHVPPELQHDEAALATHNLRIMEMVNRSGEIFMSHTSAKGRIGLRLALGNWRTGAAEVATAWNLIVKGANS